MGEIHALEWFSALARWLHVLAGLAWIGASFYLISWENKFNRIKNLGEGVEGDFWTIQGGDFYFVQKLKSAPDPLPDALHWFKYEAYFTWLSGFALMVIFYYTGSGNRLLDEASPLNNPAMAVLASSGSLVLIWLVYSMYCRTAWARNYPVTAAIGILATALLAWGYDQLFSGQAAVLHLGAAMGTIMSANVFFSIIPWHKRLISAVNASQDLGEIYRTHPGFRSRHNHYLTLPVLFLMLSAHLPLNFSGSLTWLVVTLLVMATGLFKHFHTCIQRRIPALRFLLTGVLVFSAAVAISAMGEEEQSNCREKVAFENAVQIFSTHCSFCHNANAGRGLNWKGPQELLDVAPEAINRVLVQQSMPPGNMSNMSENERQALTCWLKQNIDDIGHTRP